MEKRRTILHCDCNNFFASCECLDHPEWKTVPMAVAGDPERRAGIVVAKNELAKHAGVKTTDTIWQAREKCPGILFVPPRHHLYSQISKSINRIYREYTDYVDEVYQIDSQGFEGQHFETGFSCSSEVTVADAEGHRFSSYWWDSSAFLSGINPAGCAETRMLPPSGA